MPSVMDFSQAASTCSRGCSAAVMRAIGLPLRVMQMFSPAAALSTSSLRRALASARLMSVMCVPDQLVGHIDYGGGCAKWRPRLFDPSLNRAGYKPGDEPARHRHSARTPGGAQP